MVSLVVLQYTKICLFQIGDLEDYIDNMLIRILEVSIGSTHISA